MRQRLKWQWSLFYQLPEIIFVVAAITFKVVVSSSVPKTIFEVAEITFKVASVADINLLVAKITFVVSVVIIMEDVITS